MWSHKDRTTELERLAVTFSFSTFGIHELQFMVIHNMNNFQTIKICLAIQTLRLICNYK